MLYRDYIENLKKEWIGKSVLFEGAVYSVLDVDYNGMLLIDKKAEFTNDTAVSPLSVDIVENNARVYIDPETGDCGSALDFGIYDIDVANGNGYYDDNGDYHAYARSPEDF